MTFIDLSNLNISVIQSSFICSLCIHLFNSTEFNVIRSVTFRLSLDDLADEVMLADELSLETYDSEFSVWRLTGLTHSVA